MAKRRAIVVTIALVLFAAAAGACVLLLGNSAARRERRALVVEEAVSGSEGTAGSKPLLSQTWDFGVLRPEQQVSTTLTIANTSNHPWTTIDVSRNCACTTGEVTPPVIEPSQTAKMEIGFRAPKSEGTVRKDVFERFAEADAPLAQFVIVGEIREPLSVFPGFLDSGSRVRGEGLRTAFEVRNFSGGKTAIEGVACPSWLEVSRRLVEGPGRGGIPLQCWRFDVRGDTSALPFGHTRDTLVVQTAWREKPQIAIPVAVYLQQPVEVSPHRLFFGKLGLGESARAEVEITVAPGYGEFSERSFAFSHNLGDEMQLRVLPAKNPASFVLVGLFAPKKARGLVEGKLEVRVEGDRRVPPIELPVSVWTR